IGSRNQTLAWYREARVAMRAGGTVFAREDEQTALAVLRRAFETARAQAAVLAVGSGPATAPQPAEAGPLAKKRAEVNAAIQADQQEVERLRQVLRTAPAARRAAVQTTSRRPRTGWSWTAFASTSCPGWRRPMSR